MAKVGLLGLNDDRDAILTLLHDLRVAQVEPISPGVLLELGTEHGTEFQRKISEEALRFHGLAAALPSVDGTSPRRFQSLNEVLALAKTVTIDAQVAKLRRENDQLETEMRALDERLGLLDRLGFYPDRLEYLQGKSFVTYLGEAPPKAADAWKTSLLSAPGAQVIDGPTDQVHRFLVSLAKDRVEMAVRSSTAAGVRLTALPEFSRTTAEEVTATQEACARAKAAHAENLQKLEEISRAWYGTVVSIDEALQVQARQLEILPKMASSPGVFALEAWVPEREVQGLRKAVERAAGGRTVFYHLDSTDTPPTLLDNPPGIRWFEFFIRFYSLPKSTEWDPTWVFALVFPVFFGFMIGDWGYGLVILLVSLWMLAGFPGARRLPKGGRDFIRTIMGPSTLQALARTLVPGAVIALVFGFYFDSFFGFSLLHALVGYRAPVRPNTDLARLLLVAGFIGLAMVTLGFLLGSLKEYFHHHPRAAVGKAGGIVFAWGVTFYGLGVLRHSSVAATASPYFWLAVAGAVTLVGGEGLQNGMLGLIEVVSHVLSYTRLVGILLASVILAALINAVGIGYFHSGGLAILLGVLVLFIGQSFNVILSVFEPSIQGMRLMFVEYFSKFYEGDGQEFNPFGAERKYTLRPDLDAPVPAPTPAKGS